MEGGERMTWAQMGCDQAETLRRQQVAERLNKLWTKRERADADKKKSIEKRVRAILRAERWWLKEVCWFLY